MLLLLGKGKVDVNYKNKFGDALLLADGREGVMQLLLENSGVDVDFKNEYGDTPLLVIMGRQCSCCWRNGMGGHDC